MKKTMMCAAGIVLAFALAVLGCKEQKEQGEAERVILGDEQCDEYVPLLMGKRVALFSNHTGIVGDKIIRSDGTVQYGGFTTADGMDATLIHFGTDAQGGAVRYGEHILDALISYGVHVTAIFSPEHGFRGTEDAGALISDSVDEKTGVPILSLYADVKTHSPSEESMAAFDTLVVDMQDVGLRYYTYYIALYYLMDACAHHQKSVVILDRPNPNGFYVDGGILQDEFQSGVGRLPIPTVYGMTWGELARMINGEGWLTAGKDACNLTVISLKNYTHQTIYALIRAPSPNIKDMRAVYLYASTCFFENTLVSVGRGTDFPFEVYGSPYFAGLDAYDFAFTPQSVSGATEPPFLGEICYGVDIRGGPIAGIWHEKSNLSYLVNAYNDCPAERKADFWGTADKTGQYWIDKLSGSALLRTKIVAGSTADEIKSFWQDDIKAFKARRKPYLLYAE